MALPDCRCIGSYPPEKVQQLIYCALLSLVAASGGDVGSDQFVSNPQLVTSSGSIAAGVLGWSATAVSGTITVNGSALAIGQTVRGGGYGGRTMATAIPYTVTAGSLLITTDTPA